MKCRTPVLSGLAVLACVAIALAIGHASAVLATLAVSLVTLTMTLVDPREKTQGAADGFAAPTPELYERLTTALSDRLHADLTQRVQPLIGLHLAQAGLGGFLERRGLTSAPASLTVIVAEQHDRAGIPSA